MPKGLFIVLEGIDGSGTTTQARLLADWLEARGLRAVATAEPSQGPVGCIIRQILKGRLTHCQAGQRVPVDEVTLALLFAADRSDHLQNVVLPALAAGRVVVSDRHYLSSIAYQSLGVEMAWVDAVNSLFRRPDLTVMLDIDPEVSLRRKQAQTLAADRYEQVGYLEQVRENYRRAIECARVAGERIEVIDGGQSIEAVHERIRGLAAPVLDGNREGGEA